MRNAPVDTSDRTATASVIRAVGASRQTRRRIGSREVPLRMLADGIVIGSGAELKIAWDAIRSVRFGATVGRLAFLFIDDLGSPRPFLEIVGSDGVPLRFRVRASSDEYIAFADSLAASIRRASPSPTITIRDDDFYAVARGGLCILIVTIFAAAGLMAASVGSWGGALVGAGLAAFCAWPTLRFLRDLRPTVVSDADPAALRNQLRMRGLG